MQSCKLMLKSIAHLLEASEFTSPDGTNMIKLQSLLTLVVENLHATMKMKHSAPSLLDYCWDFEKAMRESIKRVTNWSIKYFTKPEIILSHSTTHNGSFCYCKIKSDSGSAYGQDEPCK